MTESQDTNEMPDPQSPAQEPRIDDVLAESSEVGNVVGTEDDGDHAGRPGALDAAAANVLAARRRQTVFVLAGGVACGKTSAYAALYERLGRGPFAGRLFAGSRTITGFEARCHYWRESSSLTAPTMLHTQASDLPWLHLRLRDLACEETAQDLLLGDFDGEYFEALTNNELQATDLPFLRRADHVGVVLNGGKVADPATRQSQCNDAKHLVTQLVKDPLHAPPSLVLIVTMVDLIEAVDDAVDRPRIERAIADVHQHISAAVEADDVPIVRLAVRSATSRFPLGHGLEDLLEILMVRRATHLPTSPPQVVGSSSLMGFRA